ncbi:hypothetical protein C2845_PM07G15190 [Panicum miliaceum]|uniref:Thioredoxin domain-containing protein n=1 Tax=Panicum miliaceum TaxID=4540 RepID=A0A3L6SJ68_PANMI|nr:hypothetical protein C2845_PM07G15190 [Panicum miliaceum]
MSESFLDRMVSQLRSTCKYYTGYPKDLGPSRIIPFTSERQFVQLLHEGRPVVVAFTIKCTYTQHLDKVLEEAAATFYPHIKFVRVECPKYPGFCLTRQRNEYPFVEVFYNPEQAASQGKSVDPNITKYSVKVLPFNYDQSVYGFREYFKKHGALPEGKVAAGIVDAEASACYIYVAEFMQGRFRAPPDITFFRCKRNRPYPSPGSSYFSYVSSMSMDW